MAADTRDLEWAGIKANALSDLRNPDWPANVRAISQNGLSLFGLDADMQLYFDGKKLRIQKRLDLEWWQSALAVLASLSTAVIAAVELLQFFDVSVH